MSQAMETEATPEVKRPEVSLAAVDTLVALIKKGVERSEPRLLHRAVRENTRVRRGATAPLLRAVVAKHVPEGCPTYGAMVQSIDKLPAPEHPAGEEGIAAPAAGEESKMDLEPPPSTPAAAKEPVPDAVLPEVEVYIFTLVVTTLLAHDLAQDAAFAATQLVERVRAVNRRTLDPFSAKAFFYLSLSYERIGRLQNVRALLLQLYCTSCLRHDEVGQAMLLNLLLRNYLQYNLVDQAAKLVSKSNFPEGASNSQFCRYLYYVGRIRATQLDYTEAYVRLMQAARKAPQEGGLGFLRTVHKLAVLVQLLMGDIPERATFNQRELRSALLPYLRVTQAVRTGDLRAFRACVEENADAFRRDKNYTLIQRLGYNVVKTGLRKMNLSYSRISLEDVAEKLRLPNRRTAEYVCARAIADGVIEATLDHENGWLSSDDASGLYSTPEPQQAFHRRIAFCLDVHNEAVKSMRYGSSSFKKETPAAAPEKTDEEIVKEIEELDDEEI